MRSLLSVICVTGTAGGTLDSSILPVVPMPSSAQLGDSQRVLSASFRFTANVTNPTLTAAFNRFDQLLLQHSSTDSKQSMPNQLQTIRLLVSDTRELPPQLDTDESYTLTVPDGLSHKDGSLECATVYGCVQGLQTFRYS